MYNKFADMYKHSNVISLPKKGDNSDPSNVRPVLLLSNIDKLQERIVLNISTTFYMKMIYLKNISLGFYPTILQLSNF